MLILKIITSKKQKEYQGKTENYQVISSMKFDRNPVFGLCPSSLIPNLIFYMVFILFNGIICWKHIYAIMKNNNISSM